MRMGHRSKLFLHIRMDPFSFALLPLFGMLRADTTTTFDELIMHSDTKMCHWWRLVCACVRYTVTSSPPKLSFFGADTGLHQTSSLI
jgi:hypothetical protein